MCSGSWRSSQPSSFPGSVIIIRIFGYDWFTVLWVVILVSSSLLIQLSESFLIIPTTTTIISSTRHHPPVIQHNHGQYYFDNVIICSSNHYYSVRRHGRITVLSSQQQNTIEEEKEKSATTKTKRRTWEESFQLLVSYKEKHGNCNVPYRYKEDSRLGRWVISQRQRKDRLSDQRIVKLDDLGFLWSEKQRAWEESFQLLVSYNEIHGNCNVPTKYKDDLRLGNWVNTQRRTKDKLSDECIAKLDGIGFLWANELYEEQWEVMFEKLVQYAKKNNGDCNVPGNHDDKNKELYMWVREQRLRKYLLSMEQRTRLDNIGLIWEDSKKVKADQKWNEQYETLKLYKRKYGDCKVPYRWVDDRALGKWVFWQRQLYKKGQLREDRQMKLEQMGFTWKVRNGNAPDVSKLDFHWLVKFGILLHFLEDHGHCDVPQLYKKDKSLGLWVSKQRVKQRNGSLREDRKERLDDIGFTWSFDDQKDEQWREKYEELRCYKEMNGHLRLPETLRSLKDWVSRQRVQFAAGKVTPERKALLDEIEFRWEIQNSSS